MICLISCSNFFKKGILNQQINNNNKKGELLHTDYKLYRAIAEVKHKWAVYMSVFGFQPDGKPYSKSSELSTEIRYYQRDLVDHLNEEHQKLVKNFNHEQKHGAGWIASPVGRELTEEEAFNIFETLFNILLSEAIFLNKILPWTVSQ